MKLLITTFAFILMLNNATAHDSHTHSDNIRALKVYTELDFVPFNFYDEKDEFVGIGVEIMDEILKDAKFDHTKPKILPWARGYHLAQNVPNTALFSIYRTPLRENLFYWVGPIARSRIIILTKVENSFDPDNFKIAAVRDSASMQYALENNIKDENIMKTNQTDLGLKLLNLDRVDAWAIDYHTAAQAIKTNKLNINDYYIYDTLAEQDIYFVLSKDTNQDIKNYFSEKIDELRKSGFIDKVLDKYDYKNFDIFSE